MGAGLKQRKSLSCIVGLAVWLGAGLAVWLGAIAAFSTAQGAQPAPPVAEPRPIADLITSQQYKRMVNDRDVVSIADLGDADAKGIRIYQFTAAMQVHADLARVEKTLTDYALYAKLVPYVDHASYSKESETLDIEGGIWKFKMHSWIRFDQKSDHWIHYRIVAGHFTGLSGDLYFEPIGEKGTVVSIRGLTTGKAWPPAFVIERGAEIVFGFTAKRMRSYIEENDLSPDIKGNGKNNDPQIPQPRRRL